MKVSIDQTKCVMCATCVAICPEVFEMTDEGTIDVKAEFKGVEITDAGIQAKVKEAAEACAATAIVIEE